MELGMFWDTHYILEKKIKIAFSIRVWFWLTPPSLVEDHTLEFFLDPSLIRITYELRWNFYKILMVIL